MVQEALQILYPYSDQMMMKMMVGDENDDNDDHNVDSDDDYDHKVYCYLLTLISHYHLLSVVP